MGTFLDTLKLGKSVSVKKILIPPKRGLSYPIKSITHQSFDFLSVDDIAEPLEMIRRKIAEKSLPEREKEALNSLLEELTQFELGRFLIYNKGSLNGIWTFYVVTGSENKTLTNDLERFILTQAPSFLATQERFRIFKNLLEKHITSNTQICSVPSGLLPEFLNMHLAPHISDIKFVGVDTDKEVLEEAMRLVDFYHGNNKKISYAFYHNDAWEMDFEDQFSILISNGLNIYEPNNVKIIDLYKKFFTALQPNGILICSALSYPPYVSPEKSEWKLENINTDHAQKQKMIFHDIIEAKWLNFRTSAETIEQLTIAGFRDIEIFWDHACIFYTVLARK